MFEPDYSEYRDSIACSYKEFVQLSDGCNVGDNFAHQELVARLVGSTVTGVDELLVFHEMGTGKTRTAVAVAERLRKLGGYRGALILTKGQGTASVFRSEISRTGGADFYTFFTFEMFAKHLASVPRSVSLARYDRFLVVVDEVHHVRDESKLYPLLHSLLHSLERRKVLLMSGTPVRDAPDEICTVMNLILERQVSSVDDDLETAFINKTSFVSAPLGAVPVRYHGTVPGSHTRLVTLAASPVQTAAYAAAWAADGVSANIYSNSRQASLCTDSGGRYGSSIRFDRRDFDTPAALARHSCKYAAVVAALVDAADRHQLSMVYCDSVRGGGLLLLSRILECYGFSRRLGERRSYVMLTSAMSDAQKSYYVDAWNADSNADGSTALVLLCSRVMSEGYTFNHITHEHVLTLFWNSAETSQVVARGVRFGSHDALLRRGPVECVNVYLYAAVFEGMQSIDLMMNAVAESKDVSLSKITRLLKETAIDCQVMKRRNAGGEDYSRRCDFRPCEYRCATEAPPVVVEKNFDILFFKESEEFRHLYGRMRERMLWSEVRETFADVSPQKWAQVVHEYVESNGLDRDEFGVFRPRPYSDDGFFSSTLPEEVVQLDDFESFVDGQMAASFDPYGTFGTADVVSRVRLLPKPLQMRVLCNVLQYGYDCPDVLEYYSSSVVREEDGSVYVFDGDFEWGCRDGAVLESVGDARERRVAALNSNPTGYYGQENRFTGEFCLRSVATGSAPADRRCVHSGRRCVNWNKNDLEALCSAVAPDADVSLMNRREMCSAIRDYYRSRGLVEHDESCGNQRKRKRLK